MDRRDWDRYFKVEPGAPDPLSATVRRRVRFEEVDSFGVVWHGRYPSYLEDGRTALGEQYGLGYLDMYEEKFVAPIVEMHLDYHHPLTFSEEFTMVARLHWAEAVRLDFSYRLTNAEGEAIATGYTIQLLMDFDRNLLLVRPDFLQDFCQRWKDGQVTP